MFSLYKKIFVTIIGDKIPLEKTKTNIIELFKSMLTPSGVGQLFESSLADLDRPAPGGQASSFRATKLI